MRKLYRRLISFDKFGLLRGLILLPIITIVVFWVLYSIIDVHTADRCKNRLKEECDLVAVRFDGLLEADINKLNVAVSLFGEYGSPTDISKKGLEAVRETAGFLDVFILNNNGSITGSVFRTDLDYSKIVGEVFRSTDGAVCIKNDSEYYIAVFTPLFEGRTALVGVVDNDAYADTLAMRGALFADEVSLIDNSTGDIILQCKDDKIDISDKGKNVYNDFKKWNFISDNDSDSLGFSMQNGYAEKYEYRDEQGDIQYGSFSPLAKSNWSVMMTMSGGIVSTQSDGFMKDLVIVVVILTTIYVVMLFASMLTIIRKSKESETIMMQYRVAELANEAKTNFMSNMSHDIRTPINAIVGLADICEMNADNPERVRDCISKQKAASEHLMTLINDVLDMSRIESGKIVIGNSEFDIGKQIHNIVIMLQGQMDEKNLECKVSVGNMYHEKALGDVQRINRVLLNIIGNSIKYTNPGGRVGIKINEKNSEKEGYSEYEYIISDTGIGMTQEFIKKIFVPFERMQDSTVSQIEGAGLGMTIANDLVSKMGGSIDVKSDIGRGTTVTVTLSLKYVEERLDNAECIENYKNKYVIVVDDDPDLVEWMYRLVISFEMRCVATTSSYEAINKVKELTADGEDIAFMIIGWMMPRMNGLELAGEMRKVVGNDIPILVQTSYPTSEVEKEMRAAGINEVFIEPIFRNDFLGIINDISTGGSEGRMQIPDFSGRRILLVEDHKVNAEIVTEYLTYTGIEVEVVYDGTEAVDRMKKVPDGYYDLILMDIRMPKMNGYDATRTIRAMRSSYTSSVPIIALSANAFIEDRKMSEEVGMNGHLAKPVKYDEIYDELKKWFK